ncbi:MAG TPA: arginase family protein [Streptosporangiaceae bacterium]
MLKPSQGRLVMTGVPIDCVSAPGPDAEPFGTELSPVALRAMGLADAIGASDAGDLPVRLTGRVRDPETGIVGWPSVRDVTEAVRLQVREVAAGDRIPFMVGGCCTLLPGALAGAKDALGQIGLAYLDGHLDTYDGQTSPTGEPADMPVSVIAGNGPAAWSQHVGAPLVGPGQLMLLGPRDRAEAATLGAVLPEDCGLDAELSPAQLRECGVGAAARAAAASLRERVGQFWLHLDVDVLSEEVFPATDYLMPGGLDLAELRDLLEPLVTSPGLAGLSLGCYNPSKDLDGSGAQALVTLLGHLLR